MPPALPRYLHVKYGKFMSAAGVMLEPDDRLVLNPNRSAKEPRCLVTKLRLGTDLLHTSSCCILIGAEAWET